jgi:hypothetical protein
MQTKLPREERKPSQGVQLRSASCQSAGPKSKVERYVLAAAAEVAWSSNMASITVQRGAEKSRVGRCQGPPISPAAPTSSRVSNGLAPEADRCYTSQAKQKDSTSDSGRY